MPSYMIAMLAAETADNPLIDWTTLVTQIINFLVLVAFLRIFLYKRVVTAMDRRSAKIASHFEAAETKEKDADQRLADLERQ